jgi:hypothetical protein
LIERHLEERQRRVREDEGWRYRNRLAWISERLGLEFWSKIGGLIPVHGRGRPGAISLREWGEMKDVWLVRRKPPDERPEARQQVTTVTDAVILDSAETERCPQFVWRVLLEDRALSDVREVGGWVGTRWTRDETRRTLIRKKDDSGSVPLPVLVESMHSADLGLPSLVVLRLQTRDYYSILAWNEGHPLGRWAKGISVLSAGELGAVGVPRETATGVIEAFLHGSEVEVENRLQAWRKISGLPQDLLPPECGCTDEQMSVEVALGIRLPRASPRRAGLAKYGRGEGI